MSIEQAPKSALVQRIRSLSASRARLAEIVKSPVERGVSHGAAVVGGALAGAMAGHPKTAGMKVANVPAGAIVGAVGVVVSLADLADGVSRTVGDIGAGMLAFEAGRVTQSSVQAK